MRIRPRVVGLLSLLSLFVVAERTAHACDDLAGEPATCADQVRLPPDGSIPSNLPAFYWSPTFAQTELDGAAARLERTDGPTPEPVPFHLVATAGGYWVQPDAPFVAGASYAFVRNVKCATSTSLTREDRTPIEASAATAAGRGFGTPKVTTPVTKDATYYVAPASCAAAEAHPVSARSVTIAPAADAPILPLLPYTPLYAVRLDGDDQRAYGMVAEGSALELQAYCGPPSEVASSPIKPGKHSAQLYATYPGTDERVYSDAVEVDLSCPTASAAPASTGSGCTIARGGAGGGAGILVCGALAMLAARRRRPSRY